jgi:hypothetical protein
MSPEQKLANIDAVITYPGAAAETTSSRIRLVPFDQITLSRQRRFLIKGIIPRVGLAVVWGAPKTGKSFWTFDMVMHVALGWDYRGRRVHQGPVVYCAFEGQTGIEARVEAFRQRFLVGYQFPVPFFLEPITLDLVGDHRELIATIRRQAAELPVVVVLDTLNRSLRGSESSDQDMTAYVKAADAVRDAFQCAVIVVHHCGHEGSRPRGHSSLLGNADAVLSVKRNAADNVIVEVELMKDGAAGEKIGSRLEVVEVGLDEDGEPIKTCLIIEADSPDPSSYTPTRLSKNQETMFTILHEAGAHGLTVEEWNERARKVGLGRRKADLFDFRKALLSKGLIVEGRNGWFVK